MNAAPPDLFLFLYGPDAVGKSSVAWEAYARWRSAASGRMQP